MGQRSKSKQVPRNRQKKRQGIDEGSIASELSFLIRAPRFERVEELFDASPVTVAVDHRQDVRFGLDGFGRHQGPTDRLDAFEPHRFHAPTPHEVAPSTEGRCCSSLALESRRLRRRSKVSLAASYAGSSTWCSPEIGSSVVSIAAHSACTRQGSTSTEYC